MEPQNDSESADSLEDSHDEAIEHEPKVELYDPHFGPRPRDEDWHWA